jgi:multidrug efflux pump subunit AcrB
MWIINTALRRPMTILVFVVSIILVAALALSRMQVDIFPDLNMPVVYVIQPYGGMDPGQMEGYLVSYYEYHFLYISGIEHIESKSIQSASLMKLVFHPGTNMADAMAQVVAQVERAKAFMPQGTVGPFIMRFDAGSVPVGYLVFSSETRGVKEIQDLALFRVRPIFATLPGVSAPPPVGGNQRTIVITVNPERLRAYRMPPDEVVNAVLRGSIIIPSGIVATDALWRIASINSVPKDIVEDLKMLPIRTGHGPAVYLRDIGQLEDSMDITTGYALVDGKRTVYIPVTKRSDASTLTVVSSIKQNLSFMQSRIPEDIKISFEFDQSIYVKEAINSLLFEGAMGAGLTGLMVLLFLHDLKSALIVVINIPCALMASVVALWFTGQTINIMTLGGLALAVGILVDEATVAIENIHTHLARGEPSNVAAMNACHETVTPRLLSMLAVLSVFMPSFFMVGAVKALFIPLSLAVGFSMIASYLLSNSLVPILSSYLLKHEHSPARPTSPIARFGAAFSQKVETVFESVRHAYEALVERMLAVRWLIVGAYALIIGLVLGLVYPQLGTEIFPQGNSPSFSLRMRAKAGTRIEKTEELALKALKIIGSEMGEDNIQMTLGYVGTQPPTYAILNMYIWTSGPQEAILLVAAKPDSKLSGDAVKRHLRKRLNEEMPGVQFSFEAGDIVNQVMNFGAPTPIEVALNGPNLEQDRLFAGDVLAQLKKVPHLVDVEFEQPLDYPTIDVRVDRERAGQLGVTVEEVGQSLLTSTYSSRFYQPMYWRDPKSGYSYQVQVQVPQYHMNSIRQVENIPLMPRTSTIPVQMPNKVMSLNHQEQTIPLVRHEPLGPYVRDVANVSYGTMPAEFDHYNQQRMLTISANIAGTDLGRASKAVAEAIERAGKPPRGVMVQTRGQVQPMKDTFEGLTLGLSLAIVTIFLLLLSYYQSFRLAFVTLTTIPAVVTGVVVMLYITGTTLNIESFMGSIMAVGVGVANAILLVTFSEENRQAGAGSDEAAVRGAQSRLRAILMTSIAMTAGMIPMALGLSEGGSRSAPLGRAVIGGLLASTPAVLLILPLVFAIVQGRASRKLPSLHPDDQSSETRSE